MRRLPHARARRALEHDAETFMKTCCRACRATSTRASGSTRSCGAASGGWRSAATSACRSIAPPPSIWATDQPRRKRAVELRLSKALPRPKGRATRVVYTEYDLPRDTISPHDVIVDEDGIAWYSSFGEQFLGRLDPKTGAVKEYPVPEHKPGYPTGSLGLRSDRAGDLWLGNMYQATIVKFEPKTEKFSYWTLPAGAEHRLGASQHGQPTKLARRRQGLGAEQRLCRRAPARPRHRQDRDLGAVQGGRRRAAQHLRRDPGLRRTTCSSRTSGCGTSAGSTPRPARSSCSTVPTAASAPRRGQMDAQDRLWFGKYRGDRVAMFDTRTEDVQGMAGARPRWSAPYDVVIDKNEEAWTGSMLTDQVTRLDTKTGTMVRVSVAAHHQYPPRVRRQLDHAGDVLGRLQPRRLDRQARAAGLGRFLFEHDLFRKPLHTFRDHALGLARRTSCRQGIFR